MNAEIGELTVCLTAGLLELIYCMDVNLLPDSSSIDNFLEFKVSRKLSLIDKC